jgi:hypothetical protein
MRIVDRILSGVALGALLAAGGPALYCAQAAVHVMPCCRTKARCDLGMKAIACCPVDPASGMPGKIAGAGSGSAAPGPEKGSPAAFPAPATAAMGSIGPADAASLWYPPARHGSVPIYLRHLAILC